MYYLINSRIKFIVGMEEFVFTVKVRYSRVECYIRIKLFQYEEVYHVVSHIYYFFKKKQGFWDFIFTAEVV